MRVNFSKFSVALISSTIFLSGCLKNQNPDNVPVEESPVEDPAPSPNEPDPEAPGGEDPAPEEPGSDPSPIDGQAATPYSEGTQVYGLMESDQGSANLIRVERSLSGNEVSYNIAQANDSSGSWTPYESALPFHILGNNGTGGNFISMDPESYDLDTATYTLFLPGQMQPLYELEHIVYDGSGQEIKDFFDINAKLTNLSAFIDPNSTFDSSAHIYKEVLTNPEEVVMYFPGNNDGTNCKLADNTLLTQTLEETNNCNLLVDDTLSPYTYIGDFSGTSIETAPTIRMSAIINEDIKIVLHGIDPEMDSGYIYRASENNTDNRIGHLQTVSGPNGSYLEMVFDNLQSQPFFDKTYIPSIDVTKLIFAEDGQYVRVGFAIPKSTRIDNDTYLFNDSAIDQIMQSILW